MSKGRFFHKLRRKPWIQPLTEMIPVLMMTVRNGEKEMLSAFGLGAMDYITKPFSLKILKARLDRYLGLGKRMRTVQVGQAMINLDSASITFGSSIEQLTQKELLVLRCLLANSGQILSRQQLIDFAWGYEYEGTARSVDNVILALRRKLHDSDDCPCLRSHRGLGYCLSV